MTHPNPWTGMHSWYPPCVDRLYTYHSVYGRGRDPESVIETETKFRTIWKHGYILSAQARQEIFQDSLSLLHPKDILAGDTKWVFCSICKPHSGASVAGYIFAFDAATLVEHGAVIGISDMMYLYSDMLRLLGLEDIMFSAALLDAPDQHKEAFREIAAWVQNHWRLAGRQAKLWTDWVTGRRDHSPLNLAVLRWVYRELNSRTWYLIDKLATDRHVALNQAELLYPRMLPLKHCVGVVFRKDWYEIDDFIAYYGRPGGLDEPPPPPSLSQARFVESHMGHPMRCPNCRDWMLHPPGWLPGEDEWGWSRMSVQGYRRKLVPGYEDTQDVWYCPNCDAAFLHSFEGTYEPITYIGKYHELEDAPSL